VIWVLPPLMPTWQPTEGSTWGLEITLSSSTIATRRVGSPVAAQAAAPVSSRQALAPAPLKSMVMNQAGPRCGSVTASAPETAAPVRAAGPSRSG
jgi:hypothetical protein